MASPYTSLAHSNISMSSDLFASCHVGISISSDTGVTFGVALPLFAFYFGVSGIIPDAWLYKWDWYDLSVAIHDWAIWINAWADDSQTDYREPWWKRRKFNWCPVDTFLGRPKYSEHELDQRNVVIPMPEKSYPATVKLFESSWKRPRSLTCPETTFAGAISAMVKSILRTRECYGGSVAWRPES